MKYRAMKSFYGDLGSIKRNQIVTDPDDRVAKALVTKKLLVLVGDEATDGLDKLTVGKLKAHAEKRAIDLTGVRTKADILAAIRSVAPTE